MNKRTQTPPRRTKAKQQKGSSNLRTYSLVFVCVLMLVSGFFLAARQHFSSMDFGMKNSRLRKQVDDLEAEKRRLLLAREISLSPNEIKKAAKKTGIIEPSGSSGEIAQVVSTTKEKALPPRVSETKSMVIKTAAVSPVQKPIVASFTKKEKAKPVKPKVVVD
ncbi:MAG: hypothetical protein ACKVRN_13585 [Pyrinomonadaceae bacterium]